MTPTERPALLPPPDGFEVANLPRPRSRRSLLLGIVLGVLGLLVVAIVGLVVLMLRYEEQQVALVEDAFATLAAGDALPTELVCADPDEVVSGLTENPRIWPVDSYEVLGVSSLTPVTPTSMWYVDTIVNDEQWIVEVWDADAGRMAGVCGIVRHPER